VWLFLADGAMPFMEAAGRVFGERILAAEDGSTATGSQAAVGRRLLQLVFGIQEDGRLLPGVLAHLVGDPGSTQAQAGLRNHVDAALEADPTMTTAAVDMITSYHRRRADRGDVQALVDLGDFLYWGEPESARAAYQEAIDAGHLHAMIDLAKVLHAVLGDDDAALAVYRQAIDSGDSELAAEAMVELAQMYGLQENGPAARAMYEQAIDTGHAEWAAIAMVALAYENQRAHDPDAAEALCRRAIEIGNADGSARASILLAELCNERGDVGEALAIWRRLIDSGNSQWAAAALIEVVNLLRGENDLDGLRAVHLKAADNENPDAPYALDVIGQLLKQRGDIEGAHAAWQQAIDTGYRWADELRDQISPPPEPEDEPEGDERAEVAPEFDPRNLVRIGIDVLSRGLPALPDTLNYHMAIPVAYWEADECAVVLVLEFSRHGRGTHHAVGMRATYSRTADGWTAPARFHGSGFNHDPIASPGDSRDLDGRPMTVSAGSEASEVTPGHPTFIVTGRAAPDVRHLAVIQDGKEVRRPLDSYFGAWIVCMERLDPYEIVGLDENGAVLARIQGPYRRPES
jgi:tetratricopeptide (TPR) repeat protein